MPALALTIDDRPPLTHVRYKNAARGGGSVTAHLAVERARARALPDGLDALVLTGDLQGVVPDPRGGPNQLLGVAVAEVLEELAFDEVLPPADRIGVILAGDLYSVPDADRRGGHGDVAPVWLAFAERFAWVAGVAGNHDDVEAVPARANLHLLDGQQRSLGGLRIGGVGRIIGDPGKRGRRDHDAQLKQIAAAGAGADLLVLHEGPPGHGPDQRGHAAIAETLANQGVPLTVCGHDHWPTALADTAHGQVLNVDARVVVVQR